MVIKLRTKKLQGENHERIRFGQWLILLSFQVACYSFPKKKIKILRSVKLKQQDFSSEVFVNAVEVTLI